MNEWPAAWERGLEIGLPRPFIGRLVYRLPIKKVYEAIKAAEGKRDPKSYIIAVLQK